MLGDIWLLSPRLYENGRPKSFARESESAVELKRLEPTVKEPGFFIFSELRLDMSFPYMGVYNVPLRKKI